MPSGRLASAVTTPALEIEPLFHQKLSPGSGSVAPITLLRALSVEFDRSGGLVLRSIPRDDVPRTTTILTDGIGPMHESFAGGSEGLLGEVLPRFAFTPCLLFASTPFLFASKVA